MRTSILFLVLMITSCSVNRNASKDLVIDESTNELAEKQQDRIEFYYSPNFDSIARQHMILVYSDDKIGYKNLLGEWVIPLDYTFHPVYSSGWSEGTLIVQKDGNLGVINIENEVIIPFDERWEKINVCTSGVFLIFTVDDEFVYFSKYGKQLTPYQQQLTYPPYSSPMDFENGICLVGWKRINKSTNSNKSNYSIVNNQFDTLYSFKDVWFKIRLGTQSEGLTPIYLYPDMNYGGEGVEKGFYGYLNEEGEIAIDIQFSSEYYWGKQKGMSVINIGNNFKSGVALSRIGDSVIYIDTKGDHLNLSHSFNSYGIGVEHKKDFIWIFNKQGDTLLVGGKNISLGGFGHSLVGGSTSMYIGDDIISLVDSKNRIQYFYSPDFTKLAEFDYSNRDSIYYQLPFSPSDQVLFGIKSVEKGSMHESLMYTQIFGHKGEQLSTKLPKRVEVFPKIGCYIDYRPDSLGNQRSRLMNFKNEVLFEDSTLQIVETRSDRLSHEYGLFTLQRKIVTENSDYTRFEDVGFINHLGQIISTNPEQSIIPTDIAEQRQAYRKMDTVQLNVDPSYFFKKFKELGLEKYENSY